jgi:hypothetical protein
LFTVRIAWVGAGHERLPSHIQLLAVKEVYAPASRTLATFRPDGHPFTYVVR